MACSQNRFLDVFNRLLAGFGPQNWWPAETPFEMMVGAILTQHTSWTGAAQAISALKASARFTPRSLLEMPDAKLEALIRPAGSFRVKARRLKAFLEYFAQQYGGEVGRMRERPLAALRAELLGVYGIGPETADCVLLYGLGKPVFVVDAYTHRIFGRLGLAKETDDYAALQGRFVEALPEDAALYNEYHALIVVLGKQVCRPKPRCGQCPVAEGCPAGQRVLSKS